MAIRGKPSSWGPRETVVKIARNSLPLYNKDASWQRLSPGGVIVSKAGERIRTVDVQLGKLQAYPVSGEAAGACEGDVSTPTNRLPNGAQLDPDLAAVIAAWPGLSDAARGAVLAMVKAMK